MRSGDGSNVTPSRLLLIPPLRHRDDRGWFSETYSARRLAALGIDCRFPQENQSFSARAGTVRGLHFQHPPSAQAKLVSCLAGRILDYVADIRVGSPTFGKSMAVELTDAGEQLFIPIGFAHGFVTLVDETTVSYKVSAPYDPATEDGIAWNDPDLGIDWPLPAGGAILSDKDGRLGPLSLLQSPFAYEGSGPLVLESLPTG
ncbi:dTDP-4-dehydrorhamnose 3,5-epimerase [Brevundimonas sp.]|uniref:dTDP-4-dehydrorhamnose 3,5-epimerase n=1 Tax=Brevundimonas sp. TaxID=1871086 RepID=UPI002606F506|nr:dTDP-4-dehydrorhamnose 3,5-epimerase [Brevundimonas sp.]